MHYSGAQKQGSRNKEFGQRAFTKWFVTEQGEGIPIFIRALLSKRADIDKLQQSQIQCKHPRHALSLSDCSVNRIYYLIITVFFHLYIICMEDKK